MGQRARWARGRDGRVVDQEGETGESHTQTYLTRDSSMTPPAARSSRTEPDWCFQTEPRQEGVREDLSQGIQESGTPMRTKLSRMVDPVGT